MISKTQRILWIDIPTSTPDGVKIFRYKVWRTYVKVFGITVYRYDEHITHKD